MHACIHLCIHLRNSSFAFPSCVCASSSVVHSWALPVDGVVLLDFFEELVKLLSALSIRPKIKVLQPVADVTVDRPCRNKPAYVTCISLSLHVPLDAIKVGRVRVVPAQLPQSIVNYLRARIPFVAHLTVCVVPTLPVAPVLSKGDATSSRWSLFTAAKRFLPGSKEISGGSSPS